MPYYFRRSQALWAAPLLIFLGGCNPKTECDTFETRNAVLKIISDDHSNPLGTYAAKESTEDKGNPGSTSPKAGQPANSESTKPLYRLGERIVTTSTSKDKRTLECSGAISATVGDTKAAKEVNFTVQQASDGKISVSVAPFQF
jgi:hypothetical protein